MWQALPAALLYIGWGTHRSTVPKCWAVIYPFLNKDLSQRSWQWVGPSYPRLISPYWHPDKLLPLNVQLVLVLLLLLWQSTVPRVSYERKHLIGFIVSWVIVMVEQSHGGKNSWGLKPWSVSRRQESTLDQCQSFETIRSAPQWHAFSSRAIPPNPFQKVPQTWTKYSNTWVYGCRSYLSHQDF